MAKTKFINPDNFFVSPDILQNQPLIHLSGTSRLHIENHKGIIEYSPTLVRVDTTCGIFYVHGRELLVKEIDTTNILVFGEIKSMNY